MRPVLLIALSALAALSSASKVVLGKLGKTTIDAQIYAAPSSKARGIYRITAQTPIVVRSSTPRWAAVVLNGGRLGYVPAQAVELVKGDNGLTYEVTSESTPTHRRVGTGYLASRGGTPRVGLDARATMAANAMNLEGTTPYLWGGTQLGSGIDCSGFVQKMAGQIGMALPRTAAEQAQVGMPIYRLEDLRPGDRLYFWDAKRGMIGHTGIYVGSGYFTHSSSGHHGIAHDVLSARWQRILVAARR